MRAISFFLMLIVSAVAYGQRLNALCQKMVSRIEITVHSKYSEMKDHITVEFTYDDNCALVGLQLVNKPLNFNGETKRYEIQRKGGTLVRTDYINGKVDNNYIYRYEMDGNRIMKIETYDHPINGTSECMRYDLDFEYDYLCAHDGLKLKSITDTWYTRDAGTRTFVKGDGQYKGIQVLSFEDGNFNRRFKTISYRGSVSETQFKEGVYTYDQVEDDTNMNWAYLVMCYSPGGGLRTPEFFTEWAGLHSFNHLIAVRKGNQYYDLEYFNDEQGDLSKINVYKGRKSWLNMEVSVSYVQE